MLKEVNKQTGEIGEVVAGGILYADLPIGSWIKNDRTTLPVGFLKEGDSISQSEYPELYAMYGSTVPYKADTSELSEWETSDFANNTDKTMPYDGVGMISNGNDTSVSITVNGVEIGSDSGRSTYSSSSIFFQFKKNDIIKFSITNGSIVNQKVAYYKKSLIVKAKNIGIPSNFSDAIQRAMNLWYSQIADIDPDWQTNLTSMGALANMFSNKKSVYINFSIAETTTAVSIGLLPKTLQNVGGILHFVTGANTTGGRAYAIFVPDLARNHPYFCEASNWKENSSWGWKYGDNVYSTSETVTDKVWIDGKPIYRRVLTISSKVEVSTSGTNISSKLVETPADIMSWGIADVVFLQKAGNSSESLDVSLNTSTGDINATSLTNNSITLNAGHHIMIEYTKTTD